MPDIPIKEHLMALPNFGGNTCFGCGPANRDGLHMEFHTDGERVYSWIHVPRHLCGWGSIVHGGVLATMLDEIMSWSAMYLTGFAILTKSIAIDFLKPVRALEEVRVSGLVRNRNGDREVEIEGFIHDGKDRLCARSSGTFSLFSPGRLREKGMIDAEMTGFFDRLFETAKK